MSQLSTRPKPRTTTQPEHTMNPTLDTLLHRNSLRPNQMQEPTPSDAELQTILRAATRVSDHGNLNPWRLDVYRKPAQEKLVATLLDIWTQKNPDADAALTAKKNRLRRPRAATRHGIEPHQPREQRAAYRTNPLRCCCLPKPYHRRDRPWLRQLLADFLGSTRCRRQTGAERHA